MRAPCGYQCLRDYVATDGTSTTVFIGSHYFYRKQISTQKNPKSFNVIGGDDGELIYCTNSNLGRFNLYSIFDLPAIKKTL